MNTNSHHPQRLLVSTVAFLLLGAGPILVDTEGTGQGVGWQGGIVRFNPETGKEGELGRLSNDEAVELVRQLFSEWRDLTWHGIKVADFEVAEGSGLGSVDPSNLNDHFSYCPPDELCPSEDPPFVIGSARTGVSPIVFDDTGEITDLIQGEGARESVLGFAGPRVVERVDGILVITEGEAVLNGLFIDCPDGASSSDPCQDPEVSLEEYSGAIFHEIGHMIGLDHTQVNLQAATRALQGDASQVAGIPTMLPLLVDGEAQRSPHFDDIVSLALLYPSAEFLSSFCSLEGTVYRSDGETELQGVNVVAAELTEPLIESTSFVSGQLYKGTSEACDFPEGRFVIEGLTPGKQYALGVERISRAFTGGSSIEPCDPPQSGFEETTLPGTFSCSQGGEIITVGTQSTTKIVTTKAAAEGGGSDGGGGCSLIPLTSTRFTL